MGSLTYIEKLMEELVSLTTEQNRLLETLLVKSYPEVAKKEKKKEE